LKAIVRDRYGSPDVLRLEEVERPTPREGEALVEVHAASPMFDGTAAPRIIQP